MTDEELDLLASAYVDGEATPDEVALVERDPELQARVEAFRAVEIDGSVTPPAGLVDRHLAAAMAEFDALAGAAEPADAGATGTVEAEAAAPVVDLRAAAAQRGERQSTASANGARPARRRAPRTMPSWLPAAAGFVIIGGGLVWALGQAGGGSDDDSDAGSDATETAALAVDEEASEESEDADTAVDDAAEGDGVAASSAMAEEEAMEEDDAMAGDEAGRSGADAPAGDDGDSDDSADDAEADFADPLPLLFFDEIPDLDTIDDLPELESDIERSRCGPEIVTEALGDLLGFVTVEVDGELTELYLFRDGDGAEIRLLVDQACLPIAP